MTQAAAQQDNEPRVRTDLLESGWTQSPDDDNVYLCPVPPEITQAMRRSGSVHNGIVSGCAALRSLLNSVIRFMNNKQ